MAHLAGIDLVTHELVVDGEDGNKQLQNFICTTFSRLVKDRYY